MGIIFRNLKKTVMSWWKTHVQGLSGQHNLYDPYNTNDYRFVEPRGALQHDPYAKKQGTPSDNLVSSVGPVFKSKAASVNMINQTPAKDIEYFPKSNAPADEAHLSPEAK